MNTIEIVNRSRYMPVNELEMIHVVREYINEKKGIYVDILTTKHPRVAFSLSSHMNKLLYAFETACVYFKTK